MGEVSRRRSRGEPTEDREQPRLLCQWPEQPSNQGITPTTVLFGLPVVERAAQTGASKRTPYRRTSCVEAEGMDSLFASKLAGGLPRQAREPRTARGSRRTVSSASFPARQ